MRPDVDTFTADAWARLPEYLRSADVADGDWPALRLLWSMFAGADLVADWVELLEADALEPGAVSALTTPEEATAETLPWLAQWTPVPDALAGSTIAGTLAQLDADFATLGAIDAEYATLGEAAQHGLVTGDAVRTLEDLRAALVAFRDAGWRPGSHDWLRALLAPYLTGNRTVRISPNTPGPWQTKVTTFPAETPTPSAVAAIVAVNADLLPAGLELTYATEGATLGDLAANFATLGAINAAFATLDDVAGYLPPP